MSDPLILMKNYFAWGMHCFWCILSPQCWHSTGKMNKIIKSLIKSVSGASLNSLSKLAAKSLNHWVGELGCNGQYSNQLIQKFKISPQDLARDET